MHTSTSLRWLVVAVSAAMLLAVAAACSSETIEVPGETVVVKEEVIKTVEVPGETIVKEVIKEVMVPGETVVVEKVVTETVEVPGQTVVVEKVVTETVEVPGETVTVEVVKEVQVPGETVVVEKVVTQTVQVPGETVVVEKEVVKTVEVPGQTVVVEKEVVKTVEVPGPERVVVKEVEVRPGYVRNVWGELVAKPQYGGTITYATGNDIGGQVDTYDAYSFAQRPVLDPLMTSNYAIPREEYDFRQGVVSLSVMRGNLAESYELPDPFTWIFKIRQGVYWHDKAPMNGREFDAYDVEYHWHRMLGLGSGYTEPSAFTPGDNVIESVTATDKWTVVFKTSSYSPKTLYQLVFWNPIPPPEVVKQYGGIKDWTQLVGTGPYEMTDFVEATSWTYTKNPNYWGTDEVHPGMRLPYADEIRQLLVPDFATRMAALRTGKNVLMDEIPFDQVESIQRSRPELMLGQTKPRSIHITLKVNEPPFDDIRVRHAMQKALDLETINETYLLGFANITPMGTIGPGWPGYFVPFDEWPEETKDIFSYDPEGAKMLLDDVGLTPGADGMRFKTKYDVIPGWGMDLDLNQIFKAYWAEIGADVELNILESGAGLERYMDKSYEGMLYSENRASNRQPMDNLQFFRSGWQWGTSLVDDPVYDELYDKAAALIDEEEIRKLAVQMDMRSIEMAWTLFLPIQPNLVFYQPWLKGYYGQGGGGFVATSQGLAVSVYTWIDQELREAMGD